MALSNNIIKSGEKKAAHACCGETLSLSPIFQNSHGALRSFHYLSRRDSPSATLTPALAVRKVCEFVHIFLLSAQSQVTSGLPGMHSGAYIWGEALCSAHKATASQRTAAYFSCIMNDSRM